MSAETETIQAGDMVVITNPDSKSVIKNALRKCHAIDKGQVVVDDFGVARYYPMAWCKKHIPQEETPTTPEPNISGDEWAKAPEDPDEEAMNYTKICLATAYNHGLEVEFVFYALKEMKSDPTLTLQQAMHRSMLEWDM